MIGVVSSIAFCAVEVLQQRVDELVAGGLPRVVLTRPPLPTDKEFPPPLVTSRRDDFFLDQPLIALQVPDVALVVGDLLFRDVLIGLQRSDAIAGHEMPNIPP